jgi:hypothetical protein
VQEDLLDFWRFLLALWREWKVLLTGGGIIALLTAWGFIVHKPVPQEVYWFIVGCTFILAAFRAWQMEGRLGSKLVLRVLPDTQIKLWHPRPYEIHSDLRIRLENHNIAPGRAASLQLQMIRRGPLGFRRLIALRELVPASNIEGGLFKDVSVPGMGPMELWIQMRHQFPSDLDPSDLAGKHFLRLIFRAFGQRDRYVDVPVNWAQAIRSLDFDPNSSRDV